jgi:hypothetical protein
MKKLLSLLLFFVFCMHSFAQLAVLDEIVGKLIPSIATGIQTVIGSSKKGKVDTAQVGTLRTNLQTQMSGLVDKMSKDEGNIDILNQAFTKTSVLMNNIGPMRTICIQEILDPIVISNSPPIEMPLIRAFQSNWATFEGQIADLSKIPDVGNNPTLQSQLTFFAQQVSSNLNKLHSDINFGATTTVNSDQKSLNNYIKNLNTSSVRSELDAIIIQIAQLQATLSGYISSFSTSIKDAKSTLKSGLK